MYNDIDVRSDYYDVKSYLELKVRVKAIFTNNERKERLKQYIKEKQQVKDDIKKISEDDNYLKALGLTTEANKQEEKRIEEQEEIKE